MLIANLSNHDKDQFTSRPLIYPRGFYNIYIYIYIYKYIIGTNPDPNCPRVNIWKAQVSRNCSKFNARRVYKYPSPPHFFPHSLPCENTHFQTQHWQDLSLKEFFPSSSSFVRSFVSLSLSLSLKSFCSTNSGFWSSRSAVPVVSGEFFFLSWIFLVNFRDFYRGCLFCWCSLLWLWAIELGKVVDWLNLWVLLHG